ncbi:MULTISPECIES: cytochrome bc1 complex diheme cytochrome c subunit [Dermacoccus]|uniref:Cytochrome bc1 complex cytochrome c subunit n=2 Tax=Dermacoccus TaxID=57495 RepID=A0A417Z0N3_9MICO|nr:cytochrome c [Dermacoccus abyssi]RHW43900.1 cystathionine beta-lyase [Dermacoccus abyssi]
MSTLAARRRHPAALFVVLLLALVVTGGLYAAFAPKTAKAAGASAEDVKAGKQLFLSNCSTCHGTNATGTTSGPSLVGVGAASVDFQVGTGRMPLAAPNTQAQRNNVQFSDEQIAQMAAYVQSLGPGPSVPEKEYTTPNGNAAKGGELFRVNCAMCHNASGQGGALTRGKYAPTLMSVSGKHIYEAMVTGPQSMPVFNDTNLSPQDKKDIITYLKHVENDPAEGGHNLGALGPVTEGMFAWTFGIGLCIGVAVWLGRKAA